MLLLVEAEMDLNHCWKTDLKGLWQEEKEMLIFQRVIDIFFFLLLPLSILFVGMKIVWE